MVLRDLDLLKRFDHAEITITITTLDEDLARLLEPMAPTIGSRLNALKEMSQAGLNTYAFVGPLLPALDHNDIPEFMENIFKTGVRTIMVDSLNLKPGIWLNLEKRLANNIELKNIFYNRLFKDKKYYQNIFELIRQECVKNKINFE